MVTNDKNKKLVTKLHLIFPNENEKSWLHFTPSPFS